MFVRVALLPVAAGPGSVVLNITPESVPRMTIDSVSPGCVRFLVLSETTKVVDENVHLVIVTLMLLAAFDAVGYPDSKVCKEKFCAEIAEAGIIVRGSGTRVIFNVPEVWRLKLDNDVWFVAIPLLCWFPGGNEVDGSLPVTESSDISPLTLRNEAPNVGCWGAEEVGDIPGSIVGSTVKGKPDIPGSVVRSAVTGTPVAGGVVNVAVVSPCSVRTHSHFYISACYLKTLKLSRGIITHRRVQLATIISFPLTWRRSAFAGRFH